MKKTIATITTALLLASVGTYALAQGPGPGGPGAPAAGQEQAERQDTRRGLSQDGFNRLVDARVAAIKAGLKLSAEQERLWQSVEDAIRATAAEHSARFEKRGAMREQRQSLDFMQRLEHRGTMMTERAQRTSALATAMRPLWDTLTEDQKRIAPRLMRSAMGDGMGKGRHERGGRRGHGGEHGRMGGMMQHGHGMMRSGGMMGQDSPQSPAQPQQ
jgi:hypothetical protein